MLFRDSQSSVALQERTKPFGVLVIEDQSDYFLILDIVLQRLGCKTYHAETGNAALKLVGEIEADLDLILLDCTLPDMMAPEFLDKLKIHSPQTLEKRIVPLSCHDRTSLLAKQMKEKTGRFEMKSGKIQEIERIIRTHLRLL